MSTETPASPLSISVVIPVHNAAAYLKESIGSVIGQTRLVKEIIIIDDGSTDNSLEVARSFGDRVRSFSQVRGGIGTARNAGVRKATGDLLAFLDADDRLVPDAMEILGRTLEQNPGVDAALGQMVEFLSPDLPADQLSRFKVREVPQFGFMASAMLMRRSYFLKIGLFREDLQTGEFIDWYARAQETGFHVQNVPSVTLHRRIHLNNTSHFNALKAKDYLKVIRNHLQRQLVR